MVIWDRRRLSSYVFTGKARIVASNAESLAACASTGEALGVVAGANVSEMHPLTDALNKATLAAEVPMVVSGADQVETGGSAVEETSTYTEAGTSEIDALAGRPEDCELVAEICMVAIADASGRRSSIKVPVIVITAGASELYAPAEASEDRTVLAVVLIFWCSSRRFRMDISRQSTSLCD